jgi:thioredoxin reductase (NADPH)
MQLFKNQALNYGLEIINRDVSAIKKYVDAPVIWDVAVEDTSYRTLSVIAATGAQWTKLGVPGEEEFAGRGVSYCATCDGPFYRNKDVIVVGGGDTAIQEALFLTHFARKVIVIHRRDRLRAAKILQKRAFEEKKIEFVWKAKLTEISGGEFVTGVKVADVQSKLIKAIEAEVVFIFVGRVPHTGIFRDILKLDEVGYIITDDNMHASAAGIFAAGDCRSKQFRQVITAAGDGANAVYSAELYVDELKGETY